MEKILSVPVPVPVPVVFRLIQKLRWSSALAAGGGDNQLVAVTKRAVVKAYEVLSSLVKEDSLTRAEKEKLVVYLGQYQNCMTDFTRFWRYSQCQCQYKLKLRLTSFLEK